MQDTAGIFLISCNRNRLFSDMMDVSMLIQNAKEGCGLDEKELLRQLQADGVVSAVVSNKPDYAVKTLSAQYFPGLLAASAGAKDGVRKKPCPDAVFEVVRQLGAEALRAVYIGDSEVDVATARNAGLPCISVSWGFRDRDVLVNAGAETICDSMDALYRALREG